MVPEQRKINVLLDALHSQNATSESMTSPIATEQAIPSPIRPSSQWPDLRGARLPPTIQEALNHIRLDELESRASALRAGIPCSVNTTKFNFGGRNVIYEVEFDDNVIWIARVRVCESACQTSCDVSLESEVTTLRYVKAHTTCVPVPAVYGFDPQYDNPVGSPYMFMEAMKGHQLVGGGSKDVIPETFKPKVYNQLANIILELSTLTFSKIGWLMPCETSEVSIGPINADGKSLGPFQSSIEFYWARAASAVSRDVDRFRLLASCLLVDKSYNNGPFFLTHPDFSRQNMLFDELYNITGLVDWSHCQTAPIESFTCVPPGLIPEPWKALPWPLTEAELARRELFLEIFARAEAEFPRRLPDCPLSKVQRSPRSMIAGMLDSEAIIGHPIDMHIEDLRKFVLGDSKRQLNLE
jgi:hypothetical protein